jgi:hypothetical protein
MSEIILNNYNLFFNTKYRTKGTIEYAQFQLSKAILITHPHAFFRVTITSLALPLAYNMLRAPNNTYYFNYNNGTSYNLSCVITPGNYTITTFLAILSSSIIASVLTATGNTIVLNYTYNSSTFLATLAITTPSRTITINTTDLNKSLYINTMLGFTSAYAYTSILSASGNTAVNVNPVSCIYLRSDTLGTKNMESLSTQNTFSDVLECYPTGVSFGCYLMSSGETVPTVSRLNNNCIDVVSVYLSDNASTISGNDTYDSIPQTLDYSFSMNIQEIIYDNQLTDQRHPEQKLTDTMLQQEAYQNNLIKQKQDLLTELKNKKEQITNKIKTIKPEFII